MHFLPAADENFAMAALPRFIELVGLNNWWARIDELATWRNNNPLYQEVLVDRHGFEIAFAELAEFHATHGRFPFPPDPMHHVRFYNLAMMTVAVHQRLSSIGRDRLVGYIRGCLKQVFGLGPVAFEMQVAANLMWRGFDVEFADLEGKARFDFLAKKENAELEVECKHISADIGRQIHKRKLLDLGISLLPNLDNALAAHAGAVLIRVTLPARLTNAVEHHADISQTVLAALQTGEAINGQRCTASFARMEIAQDHPLLAKPEQANKTDLIALFKPIAHLENKNVLFSFRPNRTVAGILIESAKPDKVLKEIILTLKGDAKAQFSRERPALLCAHLSDLNASQLRELGEVPGEESSLTIGVSHLIDRRPWLHTVALTATGEVIVEKGENGEVSIGQQDVSFVFYNHLHPAADIQALKGVFRSS